MEHGRANTHGQPCALSDTHGRTHGRASDRAYLLAWLHGRASLWLGRAPTAAIPLVFFDPYSSLETVFWLNSAPSVDISSNSGLNTWNARNTAYKLNKYNEMTDLPFLLLK